MGPQLHLEAAPTGDVTIPRWAGLHLKLGRRGHWAYHQAPIVTCIIIRVKVEHLSKPAVTPETLLIDEVLSVGDAEFKARSDARIRGADRRRPGGCGRRSIPRHANQQHRR